MYKLFMYCNKICFRSLCCPLSVQNYHKLKRIHANIVHFSRAFPNFWRAVYISITPLYVKYPESDLYRWSWGGGGLLKPVKQQAYWLLMWIMMLVYQIELESVLQTKFSNFSGYPSNNFFQKHLATNLAFFKIYLATFDKWLDKKAHFPSKLHKKRKPKTPRSTHITWIK